jgi:hypothetical protein
MTALHCLACDDLTALAEGGGEARCVCGRSAAELADGQVVVRGPCHIVWIDPTQAVVTVADSAQWPAGAPEVIRKVVPPLL